MAIDNKDKKVLNVPHLRFPEFTEEWVNVSLKDVADFQKERISSGLLDESTYISTENILQNFQGVQSAISIPANTNVVAYKKNDILLSNIRPYLKKVWFSDRIGGCSADVYRSEVDTIRQAEMKDIDTTTLSDYVDTCLSKMGRNLEDEQIDDLCTVIGEILINAEEHSSTKCRYSIGYFEEQEIDGEKVGVFQLVIMNLGMSIYEKFKDENCPNPIISDKMKELSKQYTHKGFLKKKEFEEETLWTLYSLQDGVTSVSPEKYKNRGNGSLRFIESFYNLKGCNASKLSKMTLQSGKANIVFDGKYPVTESMVKGEKYRVLTFNSSGNIEDKPDNKYVKCSEFFFPGTFIHAYIYL